MRSPLKELLVSVALAFLVCNTINAQDTGIPDTVYFGDQGTAHGLAGGVFKVPIYMVSDQAVIAVQPGMEMLPLNPNIVFDSVSTVFASPETWAVFDGLSFRAYTYVGDGILPDTIGMVGLGIHAPLSPGRYKLGDVYFHGASFGEFVAFDSAFAPPAADFALLEPLGEEYAPQFVGGTLEITNSPGEFYLLTPTSFAGDAGHPISLLLDVVSGWGINSASLDSIVNVSGGFQIASDSLPNVMGSNPFQAIWTPNTIQYGEWQAFFTISDGATNMLELTLNITVNELPEDCDVVRGDANCDGFVSIGDAVYLINYIFGGGLPPQCR